MRVLGPILLALLFVAAPALAQAPQAADRPVVRVLTSSFVLPEKFRALE
ncbi:MAG: hypothetical protein IH590_15240, partial [Aquamicrobium sp.]|nr:hypothetical protein [Aquamicrobium sp.]